MLPKPDSRKKAQKTQNQPLVFAHFAHFCGHPFCAKLRQLSLPSALLARHSRTLTPAWMT
jgi:hypothetical protein